MMAAASGEVRSIVVLRALALGDLLCAVPTLRLLRRQYPQARITLIGLPWAREFVARFGHLVDDHVAFPGFPGIPEVAPDAARITDFVARMQAAPRDVAVQLQGNGTASNAFVLLLGARRTVGFVPPGTTMPPGPGRWVTYQPHGHEIRRLLGIEPAFADGPSGIIAAPDDGAVDEDASRGREVSEERLEFPITEADRGELADALPVPLGRGEYIVVHPGANDPARRWHRDHFASVARALAREAPVVLTGSARESAITAAIARDAGDGVIDLAGRTSLGALAALIDGARLLVANDTGVAHVAAALRVPSVIVFTASEVERWAALDRSLHVAVGEGSTGSCLDESPGEHRLHRCLGDACTLPARRADAGLSPSPPVAEVEPRAVLDAARSLLARAVATAA